MTQEGFHDAATDAETVTKLFKRAGDCLIGARMGKASGMFAIDFDLYKDGAVDYMKQLQASGLLPLTQVHTTQNGGLHYLYSGNEYPNLVPHNGVEVKGEGGYIIVPPSKGYAIKLRGIRRAPVALVEALRKAKKTASMSTIDGLKDNILSGRDFHDSLTKLAAKWASQDVSQSEVMRRLVELMQASVAANARHMRHDRWSHIMTGEDSELARIASTAHSKYNSSVAVNKATEAFTAESVEAMQSAGMGLFGPTPNPQSDPEPAPVGPPIEEGEWPFGYTGYFSQDDRDIFNQKYVAYPLLAERETTLLAAEPKAGKSAVALKLAMQVAMGEDLGENFVVSEARPTLYFTMEGPRAIEMRIRAEHLHRRNDNKAYEGPDRLFVVDRPYNLTNEQVRTDTLARVLLHDEKCKQEFGTPLGLIVIDTLTKAMPGKDQNSVEDTSELFKFVDMMRHDGIVANVMFIHHLARAGHVRGSSNIEADVDAVFSVKKDKRTNLATLNIRMARSMDDEVRYMFRFVNCELGQTAQGHILSAPYLELVENDMENDSRDKAQMGKLVHDFFTSLANMATGEHSINDVIKQAGDIVDIPFSARRRSYTSPEVTDCLAPLFGDGLKRAFGKRVYTALRNDDKLMYKVVIEAVD